MCIYNYNEIENIIKQGNGVLINDLPINLNKYEKDDLFIQEATHLNPMNSVLFSISVKLIDRKKMEELLEYLCKNKTAKLSDLEMEFFDSEIYGLKHKGLVSIENEIVKLK